MEFGLPIRVAAISDEIRWSWDAYKKFAWGHDELQPLSRTGIRSSLLGGTSGTMIDSIDTLALAKMDDDIDSIVHWLMNHSIVSRSHGQVSVFETTIRILGGFLGAYTMSKEPIFLRQAEILGKALLPAFKHGVFRPAVNLKTGQVSTNQQYTVSELGSLQLEFYELARLTGNNRFFDAACKTQRWLLRRALRASPPYLMGTSISSSHMSMDRHMGGGIDSYYEYILKLWHQAGRRQDDLRDFYQNTSDALHRHLIRRHHGHTFVAKGRRSWSIDHLTCFAPGMFALGSTLMPHWKNARRDIETAKSLMDTCYRLYQIPGRVGCEEIKYLNGKFQVTNSDNILRPEVAESLFILFRTTGDIKYREMGWNIFQGFKKNSRISTGGYSGLKKVDTRRPTHINAMETFWIAETLKYLYLIQAPWDILDLNRSVLSTEAHIFPVSDAITHCKIPR